MANLLNKFEGLFKKVTTTEEKYKQALERKQEQLIALQAELQEKEFMLKDMQKMKLLGDISEASFDAEKEKVETLRNKISEAQKELQLIETYKTEDVKAFLLNWKQTQKNTVLNRLKKFKPLKKNFLKQNLST
jgi:Skp family chaperone for outer membrane proteins